MTVRSHPGHAASSATPLENTMTTGAIQNTPAWRRWRLGRALTQYDTETGPLLTNLTARGRREPGSGLVSAGMGLLALLDAGLLYVVYAAQYAFIFSQKHEHLAAQIQALALDAAMIIFSVLALGLARKGLPAPVERASSSYALRPPPS